MKDNYFSTIEEFKTTLPAKKLMGLAIKELFQNKNNWFGFVLSAFLGTVVAIIIGFSAETVVLLVCAEYINRCAAWNIRVHICGLFNYFSIFK